MVVMGGVQPGVRDFCYNQIQGRGNLGHHRGRKKDGQAVDATSAWMTVALKKATDGGDTGNRRR